MQEHYQQKPRQQVPSEPRSLTTIRPVYPNTREKQDLDLKITYHEADRGFKEGHK